MMDTKKAPQKAATFQGANEINSLQMHNTTKSGEIQGKSSRGKLIPTRPGEVFSLGGKSYPVTGYLSVAGMPTVPLVDLPMMTDYKWQLSCLESRLQHPEVYAQLENVEETVAKLRQWLKERSAENTDSGAGATDGEKED